MSTQHAQYVLLYSFSAGSKFHPVSNFTELHALTLATRSYVLLLLAMTSSIYRPRVHLIVGRLSASSYCTNGK